MIAPKERRIPSGGIFSAFSFNEKSHLLMLVDFLLFFIVDDGTIIPQLKEYSNIQNRKVIIGLGDNKLWFAFNQSLVQQMLQSGNQE